MVKSELNTTRYTEADTDAEMQVNPHPRVEGLFGVCYRPEVDKELMMPRIIESINSTQNENMILLGDLNFRNIDWQTGTCSRPIEQTFIGTVNNNLLIQLVEEPTRGENILELSSSKQNYRFPGFPASHEKSDCTPKATTIAWTICSQKKTGKNYWQARTSRPTGVRSRQNTSKP